MANKALFRSGTRGQKAPAADTKNAAGGLAYSFTPEHQLAQLAATGTFNDTFYEKASDQAFIQMVIEDPANNGIDVPVNIQNPVFSFGIYEIKSQPNVIHDSRLHFYHSVQMILRLTRC